MPPTIAYLDESGDLGWNFDSPYRRGGSSRHLTIAALLVPESKAHLPERIIRKLYERYKWLPAREKKGSELSGLQTKDFATRAQQLFIKNRDIILRAITVKKERVDQDLRSDSNKLYNYMVDLLIGQDLMNYAETILYPDQRTIKVESGNSMAEYLKQKQIARGGVTSVKVIPTDSRKLLGLRFVDFASHIVFSWFEDGIDVGFRTLNYQTRLARTLFFGS